MIDFLNSLGIKDPVMDSNYQLKTNYGFVHELTNGQLIFLPHDLRGDGLLVSNKKEFDKIIKKDKKGDTLKLNARIISDEGRGTLNQIANKYMQAKNTK